MYTRIGGSGEGEKRGWGRRRMERGRREREERRRRRRRWGGFEGERREGRRRLERERISESWVKGCVWCGVACARAMMDEGDGGRERRLSDQRYSEVCRRGEEWGKQGALTVGWRRRYVWTGRKGGGKRRKGCF